MAFSKIDLGHEEIVLTHLNVLNDHSKVIYPQKSDIQKCAAAIRFLLLEQGTGLAKSAKLWGIPLSFSVHDVSPLIWQAEHNYLYSYSSSFTKIYGCSNGAFKECHPNQRLAPHQYEPEKRILNNLDDFLGQKIMYGNGLFISRKELIKYVCNKMGAIHYEKKASHGLTEVKMRCFDNLQKKFALTTNEFTAINEPVLTVSLGSNTTQEDRYRYAPKVIDAVFLELHATINMINDSDSVTLLRNEIEQYLNELAS